VTFRLTPLFSPSHYPFFIFGFYMGHPCVSFPLLYFAELGSPLSLGDCSSPNDTRFYFPNAVKYTPPCRERAPFPFPKESLMSSFMFSFWAWKIPTFYLWVPLVRFIVPPQLQVLRNSSSLPLPFSLTTRCSPALKSWVNFKSFDGFVIFYTTCDSICVSFAISFRSPLRGILSGPFAAACRVFL